MRPVFSSGSQRVWKSEWNPALSTFVLASLLALPILQPQPSRAAQDAPVPTNVKIGYFDLERVKEASGGALDTEELRIQAETELRHILENGQKTLQQAKDSNQSEAEQKELTELIRSDLELKKQAFTKLVVLEKQLINQKVTVVAQEVAKKKGLDLALDSSAIYAGEKDVFDKGEDITDDIMSKFKFNSKDNKAADVNEKNSSEVKINSGANRAARSK